MQKKKYNPISSLALTIGTFILYIIAEYYSHDIDILSPISQILFLLIPTSILIGFFIEYRDNKIIREVLKLDVVFVLGVAIALIIFGNDAKNHAYSPSVFLMRFIFVYIGMAYNSIKWEN